MVCLRSVDDVEPDAEERLAGLAAEMAGDLVAFVVVVECRAWNVGVDSDGDAQGGGEL
jgi:hypothetical protein